MCVPISTATLTLSLSLYDECVCGIHRVDFVQVVTKLVEDNNGEAHSAADEAWHWPKPSL